VQVAATSPATGVVSLSPNITLLAVQTPSGFTADKNSLQAGGSLNFNNFDSMYEQGGFAPAGGIEIDITNVPMPPPPLLNLIDLELQGATITSIATLKLPNANCTQVFYDDLGANPPTKNEAVYCPSQNLLYKFYLTYDSSDPNQSQILTTFSGVINGADLNP
jgi:hypothetical protein